MRQTEAKNYGREWSDENLRELITAVRLKRERKEKVVWSDYANIYGRSERACQIAFNNYQKDARFKFCGKDTR